MGYYFLIKIPLLGVLIYGIAEASTAYLITKITVILFAATVKFLTLTS